MTDEQLADEMSKALAEAIDVLDACYQDIQRARVLVGLPPISPAIERAVMRCDLARGNWEYRIKP